MNNSQIQRQVECPVCMEQFTSPKVLPCQHTFCFQCLEGHHRSNCARNGISCPECRTQHPLPRGGISGFPTKITAQRLMEAITAPNVPQQQPTALIVQPTAPALQPIRNNDTNANSQRSSNPDELDMDRVWSLVDHQRELERNVGRNQTPDRSPRTTEESQRNVDTNNSSRQPDNHNNRCTIRNVWSIYRQYLMKLFHNEDSVLGFLILYLVFMTLSRFIAGAVKLNSHCKDEYNVAVYLFVKSWFECFHYIAIIWFLGKRKIERVLQILFVQIWLLIQTIFFVIWLIVGTYWVFGIYKEMTEKCPLYDKFWDYHFINFALFLTVVDWLIAVIFLIYSLYSIFEIYDESDT